MMDWGYIIDSDDESFTEYFKEGFSDTSPLMQYTGLKDGNGKDIYEGDHMGGYPHGDIIVTWDSDHACFGCVSSDWREDYGLLSNTLMDCDGKLEVIGNIYENPELIKG